MILRIRVIPNAKRDGFSGQREGEWVLRLRAPAVEGRATAAAQEYIAAFFGVSRSAVRLLGGEKSRHKKFEIVGLGPVDLESELRQRSES